ncbi:CNOT9-like protein, partial [Mya arenaria]
SRMMNPGAAPPTSGSGSLMVRSPMSQAEREKVYQWIGELTSPDTLENALQERSKKREVVPDLAPMLLHSLGTVAALLQEIVMCTPESNRVCNALALLQFVASHPETPKPSSLTDEQEVINFLLSTEVIPLSLQIMESGTWSELLKTVKALCQCLTDQLKDRPFVNCLKNDNFTKRCLVQLQQNLENPGVLDP